jgi:RNA polymerase sigma-70 factor, ECF subfamily
MNEPQTAEHIRAFKEGSSDAFITLWSNHELLIKNIARSRHLEPHQVDEILQNSALKLYQHLNQFRGDSKFSCWLYRLVQNEINMFLRHKTRREILDFEFLADWKKNAVANDDPFDDVALKEIQGLIRKSLPAAHIDTQVIQMRAAGYSNREASDLLKISIVAFKSRLYRVKQLFQKRLKARRVSQ